MTEEHLNIRVNEKKPSTSQEEKDGESKRKRKKKNTVSSEPVTLRKLHATYPRNISGRKGKRNLLGKETFAPRGIASGENQNKTKACSLDGEKKERSRRKRAAFSRKSSHGTREGSQKKGALSNPTKKEGPTTEEGNKDFAMRRGALSVGTKLNERDDTWREKRPALTSRRREKGQR